MITRLCAATLFGVVLSGTAYAAPIRFDFGNGNNNPDTGVPANVVITSSPVGTETATISGVTITLQGIAGPAGGAWNSTNAGIGIETTDQSGGASAQRRIDETIGEYVNFSFDYEVRINSIRLGNMAGNMSGSEVAEIAFVSGTDPFAGGSFTHNMDAGELDDIPVGVLVSAGTVLSLTASVPVQNGVLWNDIVVTPVPEPATMALLGIATAVLVFASRRREEF